MWPAEAAGSDPSVGVGVVDMNQVGALCPEETLTSSLLGLSQFGGWKWGGAQNVLWRFLRSPRGPPRRWASLAESTQTTCDMGGSRQQSMEGEFKYWSCGCSGDRWL